MKLQPKTKKKQGHQTTRYTKTAPKKEGYYWIKTPGMSPDIAWFIPFGSDAHFATPHENPIFTWSEHVKELGCVRSVREVTP
jgi:hypothetical protein